MILVICVRDPDASNDFQVYGGDVEIHDMDLGYADLDDTTEYYDWAEMHLFSAAGYEAEHPAAAAYIRSVVENAYPRHLWDNEDEGPGWEQIMALAVAYNHEDVPG